jgi:hypothetical protein
MDIVSKEDAQRCANMGTDGGISKEDAANRVTCAYTYGSSCCIHGYLADCPDCGDPPAVEAVLNIPSEGLTATLEARGQRYGQFNENALVAQELKDVMRASRKWDELMPYQKEALDIIASKISRLLSGDPNYPDNWHDIQGFAKLVEDYLPKQDGSYPDW